MTRKRLFLLYVLPTVALLLAAVWPLVRGVETLYLRDAFNTHLEMKWIQAAAMRHGTLPLIDPLRSGGQPQVGNPNTVPLYPDNLLYLVVPTFWAFNAHFWLHLLLAPFTAYWLARAWGLEREPAWAAGVCYGASGYLFSTLNLYNLVASVAWAPALVAALLQLGRPPAPGGGRWRLAVAATIWALLLLSGDPMTAAAALGLGLTALVARDGLKEVAWRRVGVAVVLGTLLAAPQIVEFLRILPTSFRGYWGYSENAAGAGSWSPVNVTEWFLPFAFGKPDLAFWGRRFHAGNLPLFYTLFPGVFALTLVAASGRPRGRASIWAWAMTGGGLLLALGRFNPLFGLLTRLPGADLLRLPVKFWLPVAVGGALLCGLGFERLRHRERRPGPILAALFAVYLVPWLLLSLRPAAAAAWLAGLIPDGMPVDLPAAERLRWAGLCLLSLALVGLYALLWRLGRRWPTAGALLVALHVGSQIFFLRPVLPTDVLGPYRRPPALLELVPKGARVVHGQANSLFEPDFVPADRYPDARSLWLERQVFDELYPVAGLIHGRRYELVTSPEGLDSFYTRATAQAVQRLPDEARLRLLAASGVELLLLGRDLAPAAASEVDFVGSRPSRGGDIKVFRLRRTALPVQMLGNVHRSADLTEALALLTDPDFDPRRDAVLPGGGPDGHGAPGRVEVLSEGPEALTVRVGSDDGGALVVQRTFLPIYRATVDGGPVPVLVANLHRVGIEVPPGEHEVRLWVDRRPFHLSLGLSLVALAALAWSLRRKENG